MQQTTVTRPVIERQGSVTELPGKNEAYSSGVSWAAVIGGAFVAATNLGVKRGEKIAELVKNIRIAMMSTVDSRCQTTAVPWQPRIHPSMARSGFLTRSSSSKVESIQAHGAVTLDYADPEHSNTSPFEARRR